jgi:hypothetical protein
VGAVLGQDGEQEAPGGGVAVAGDAKPVQVIGGAFIDTALEDELRMIAINAASLPGPDAGHSPSHSSRRARR